MAVANVDQVQDSLYRAGQVAAQRFVDSLEHVQLAHQHFMIEQAEAHDRFITIVSVCVLVLIFGSFIAYNFFNGRYWERGVFPPMLLNREVNRYEAVLNIGVAIFMCDKNGYREKQQYLNRYLNRKFPRLAGDMSDSVRSAMSVRLTVASVAYWMNKHVKLQREKEELLTFYFELATLDSVIGRREHALLQVFVEKMHLNPALLEKLVREQRQTRAERLHREQQQQRHVRREYKTDYRREKAFASLGLTVGTSLPDIKKAYRKLAMQYHPDRFQQHGDRERKAAEVRFLEIQQAYEYLVEG